MGLILNRDIIYIKDGNLSIFQSESLYQPTSSAPSTEASFHIIIDEKVGGSIVSDSAMNPYIKFSLISSSATSTGFDEELVIRFFTSSHFEDKFTSSFTSDGDIWNVSSSFKEFYYTSSNTNAEYRDIRVFATSSDSDGDANTEYATVLRNKIHDVITGSKFVQSGIISQSKSGTNTSSIFLKKIKGAVPTPVFYTGSLSAYGSSVTSSFKVQTISTGSGTLNFSEVYVLSDDSASYTIGIDPIDKLSLQISIGTASFAHTGSQATQSIVLYASGGAGGEGRVGFGTKNPKTKFDFKGDGFKVRSEDGKRELRFEDDGRFITKKFAGSATSESIGSEMILSYTPGTFDSPSRAQIGETIGTINFLDESLNSGDIENKYLRSGSVAQISSTVRRITDAGASGDLQFKVNQNPSNPEENLTSFLTIDPQTHGSTVYFPFSILTSGSSGGHITASGNISSSGTITAAAINALNGEIGGTLSTAAQPAITSVGTLSSVTVSGNITANGNIIGDGQTAISNIKQITATTITGSSVVTSHLTASGNISSSGRIISTAGFIGTINTATQGTIDIHSLSGYVANEHIDHSGVTITAGAGLLGGGTIASTRTLSIDSASIAPFFSSSANNFYTLGFISASGDLTVGGKAKITGNVTASGNISASGDLFANEITLKGDSAGISIESNNGTEIISTGNSAFNITSNKDLYLLAGSGEEVRIGSDNTNNQIRLNKGHITASGNISSSGTIIAEHIQSSDDILAADDIIVNDGGKFTLDGTGGDTYITNGGSNNIIDLAVNNTVIQRTSTAGVTITGTVTTDTSVISPRIYPSADAETGFFLGTNTSGITINGGLLTTANISASGQLNVGNIGSTNGHITASGNISSSGTVTANSLVGTLSTAAQTNITSLGQLTALNINGNLLFENNKELRWKDSGGSERTILELTNANDLYLGGSYAGSLIFVGGGSYAEVAKFDDSGHFVQASGKNLTTTHITASGNISASGTTTSLSGSFTRLDADKGSLKLRDLGWTSHTSVASTAQGDIVHHYASVATTAGAIYALQTNGNLGLADADDVATATGSLFVALDDNAQKGLLMRGMVKLSEDPLASIGQPIYLSTTVGIAQKTPPTGTGDTVRIIGFQMSGSGVVYFNPDNSSIILS